MGWGLVSLVVVVKNKGGERGGGGYGPMMRTSWSWRKMEW